MKYLPSLLLLLGIMQLTACSDNNQWSLYYQQAPLTMINEDQLELVQPLSFSVLKGYYQTFEQCKLKGKGLQKLAGDEGNFICGSQCGSTEDGEKISCLTLQNADGQPVYDKHENKL